MDTAAAAVDWGQVHERLKKRWGLLTDHDLEQAQRDVRGLVGVIQLKTGRSRDEVEPFVQETVDEATSTLGRLRANATALAEEAEGAVRQCVRHSNECLAGSYDTIRAMVQRRPMDATVVAFAAGLAGGALLGSLISRR